MLTLTRRTALFGLATVAASGKVSLAVAAAPTDRRLVVINLRGALDGLAAVVPYGERSLADLRGDLVPPEPGQPEGLFDLGGFYGLHPLLGHLHALYAAGEMIVVHAVAGPYRERSHFMAQDWLESGADHRMDSGWLNRTLSVVPDRGERKALAVGVSVPLLLRGGNLVSNWAPSGFAAPQQDLYATIATLNRGDPLIGPAIQIGLQTRAFSHAVMGEPAGTGDRNGFPALAKAAGGMLAAPDGPRVAALEIGGWDTHAAQATRLPPALRSLDAGIGALRDALGPVWQRTAVLVMTEFGRTVRKNGTGGTDHGTATVAFVLGGAIAGGRVIADWPGLAEGRLFEGRDLMPTTDLRSVAKGLLRDHLGIATPDLGTLFPDSAAAAPTLGLVRA